MRTACHIYGLYSQIWKYIQDVYIQNEFKLLMLSLLLLCCWCYLLNTSVLAWFLHVPFWLFSRSHQSFKYRSCSILLHICSSPRPNNDSDPTFALYSDMFMITLHEYKKCELLISTLKKQTWHLISLCTGIFLSILLLAVLYIINGQGTAASGRAELTSEECTNSPLHTCISIVQALFKGKECCSHHKGLGVPLCILYTKKDGIPVILPCIF